MGRARLGRNHNAWMNCAINTFLIRLQCARETQCHLSVPGFTEMGYLHIRWCCRKIKFWEVRPDFGLVNRTCGWPLIDENRLKKKRYDRNN